MEVKNEKQEQTEERDDMSADKGTYIIQTQGPEFRVAQAGSVDTLFEEFKPETNTWTPNIKKVVKDFGESKPFKSLEEAWDAAGVLDDTVPTEYGVNLITDFQNYNFAELKNGTKT